MELTDKEFTEGNQLIVEFMECKKVPTNDGKYYIEPFYKERIVETAIGTWSQSDCEYNPKDMLYHSNWSWLMPVVEKISLTQLPNGDTEILRYLTISYLLTFKKELIYRTAVAFIKWYNNQYN